MMSDIEDDLDIEFGGLRRMRGRSEKELEIPYMSKRYICDVFREMRKSLLPWKQATQYNHILSLVEEAQTLANRMEKGLEYGAGLDKMWDEMKRGKKLLQELNKQIEEKRNELQTKEQLPVAIPTERT